MENLMMIVYPLLYLIGMWGVIIENRRTRYDRMEDNDYELAPGIFEIAPDISEWSTEVIEWGYNNSGNHEYSAHEFSIELPELE